MTGRMMLGKPNAAPEHVLHFAAAFGWKRSPMIVIPIGMSAPAPIYWMARKTINCVMS